MTMKTYSCLGDWSLSEGEYSLSAIQPSHIERIRQWRNAQMDILRQTKTISSTEQRDYFTNHIWPSMILPTPPNILLSYFYKGKLIGYGGLVHISWRDLRAEVSFLLEPTRSKDQKIYTANFSHYLNLIKRLAFNQLGFHRLFTETFDTRPQHIFTLEKSGFKQEGVMKDHIIINGEYTNSILHGCLNHYER